jgi:hypothetical protein
MAMDLDQLSPVLIPTRAFHGFVVCDLTHYPPEMDNQTRGKPLVDFLRTGPHSYFFVVYGNSMNLAGIRDGDLITVDPTREPSDNDVVIALRNGTFKDGEEFVLGRFVPPFIRSESDTCQFEIHLEEDGITAVYVAETHINLRRLS